MTTDSKFDRWENWAFEDDDRFLLSFSRVMLSIILVGSLVPLTVFASAWVADLFGPLPLYAIGALLFGRWLGWTLIAGGKS